jgi:hypothetical protein
MESIRIDATSLLHPSHPPFEFAMGALVVVPIFIHLPRRKQS